MEPVRQRPTPALFRRESAEGSPGGDAVRQRPQLPRGDGRLTPLQTAALRGDLKAIERLTARTAGTATPPPPALIVQRTHGGLTALHLAAANGHSQALDRMADLVANQVWRLHENDASYDRDVIDDPGFDGRTPLHVAAAAGHATCVEVLLHHGAWANAHDRDGATPLLLACAAGNTDVVRALLKPRQWAGTLGLTLPVRREPAAWVGEKDHAGVAALHIAVAAADPESVHLLLKRGASPQDPDVEGRTPLSIIEEARRQRLVGDRAGAAIEAMLRFPAAARWFGKG